jgi:hypothetical protein
MATVLLLGLPVGWAWVAERVGSAASPHSGSEGEPAALAGSVGTSSGAPRSQIRVASPGSRPGEGSLTEAERARDRGAASMLLVASGPAFDPRDVRFLQDVIDANGLAESTTDRDVDDGDGRLEPFELGYQVWRGRRLVAFATGPDPHSSFGYGLATLPASIAEVTALEELDLSFNELTALPDTIGGLDRLETLRLHRNRLGELPESIGLLGALRVLVLSGNPLAEVPVEVFELPELEELHLNEVPLGALPEGVAALSKLRVLNLSWARPGSPAGHLESLPERLLPPDLEVLSVAGNRLYCGASPDHAPELTADGSGPLLQGLAHQRCGATPWQSLEPEL